jgi:hypothetical protein
LAYLGTGVNGMWRTNVTNCPTASRSVAPVKVSSLSKLSAP